MLKSTEMSGDLDMTETLEEIQYAASNNTFHLGPTDHWPQLSI